MNLTTASISPIVKESNRDKIEDLLCNQQSRARTRTMNYDSLMAAITMVEVSLSPLPRTLMTGVTATVTAGQAVAHSYQGRAEQTEISLLRASSGWVITEVSRGKCPSQSYGGRGRIVKSIVIHDDHCEEMMARMLKDRRINVEG